MDRKEATGLCMCRMCPSFVDCKEEIAFCLAEQGTSGCIKTEQGCLCPGCPVQAEENFRHVFYCTRGSEIGQSHAR
ncbi:MAG: DUF2769 domain-containing protein [Methanoregula sp.]|uniref:DUF2769 domain-containing protein n=1 Tax=Methanoregula sp. TaxID=2052170 RepID=UPI003C1D2561